jgi:hypothetical protein
MKNLEMPRIYDYNSFSSGKNKRHKNEYNSINLSKILKNDQSQNEIVTINKIKKFYYKK